MKDIDDRPEVTALFNSIKLALPDLKTLKSLCEEEYTAEDGIYRFYHTSFKTYHRLQPLTVKIVDLIKTLTPNPTLHPSFEDIIKGGTGITFDLSHNKDWTKHTRPILEAYFHAKHILDLLVKYGEELSYPPNLLPSGWATILYIYGLR